MAVVHVSLSSGIQEVYERPSSVPLNTPPRNPPGAGAANVFIMPWSPRLHGYNQLERERSGRTTPPGLFHGVLVSMSPVIIVASALNAYE